MVLADMKVPPTVNTWRIRSWGSISYGGTNVPKHVDDYRYGSLARPTGPGLHGEVGLAVDDAVDDPSAVPVRGVVGVRRCHLHHHGPCDRKGEKNAD